MLRSNSRDGKAQSAFWVVFVLLVVLTMGGVGYVIYSALSSPEGLGAYVGIRRR
jgi:hypothetical protein